MSDDFWQNLADTFVPMFKATRTKITEAAARMQRQAEADRAAGVPEHEIKVKAMGELKNLDYGNPITNLIAQPVIDSAINQVRADTAQEKTINDSIAAEQKGQAIINNYEVGSKARQEAIAKAIDEQKDYYADAATMGAQASQNGFKGVENPFREGSADYQRMMANTKSGIADSYAGMIDRLTRQLRGVGRLTPGQLIQMQTGLHRDQSQALGGLRNQFFGQGVDYDTMLRNNQQMLNQQGYNNSLALAGARAGQSGSWIDRLMNYDGQMYNRAYGNPYTQQGQGATQNQANYYQGKANEFPDMLGELGQAGLKAVGLIGGMVAGGPAGAAAGSTIADGVNGLLSPNKNMTQRLRAPRFQQPNFNPNWNYGGGAM